MAHSKIILFFNVCLQVAISILSGSLMCLCARSFKLLCEMPEVIQTLKAAGVAPLQPPEIVDAPCGETESLTALIPGRYCPCRGSDSAGISKRVFVGTVRV